MELLLASCKYVCSVMTRPTAAVAAQNLSALLQTNWLFFLLATPNTFSSSYVITYDSPQRSIAKQSHKSVHQFINTHISN